MESLSSPKIVRGAVEHNDNCGYLELSIHPWSAYESGEIFSGPLMDCACEPWEICFGKRRGYVEFLLRHCSAEACMAKVSMKVLSQIEGEADLHMIEGLKHNFVTQQAVRMVWFEEALVERPGLVVNDKMVLQVGLKATKRSARLKADTSRTRTNTYPYDTEANVADQPSNTSFIKHVGVAMFYVAASFTYFKLVDLATKQRYCLDSLTISFALRAVS